MFAEVCFAWSIAVLRGYIVSQHLPVVTNLAILPKLVWERVHVGATYGGGYERPPHRNLTRRRNWKRSGD